MNLPPNTILKFILSLYGIPEVGTHRFNTYHNHHTKKLNLELSTFDPFLLFKNAQKTVVGLQTDDTFIVATPTLIVLETRKLKKANLLPKPLQKII